MQKNERLLTRMNGFTRFYQKLAARRRLFKHDGVRAAIERGWWPYLPLRWVVLNDKEILKVTGEIGEEGEGWRSP